MKPAIKTKNKPTNTANKANTSEKRSGQKPKSLEHYLAFFIWLRVSNLNMRRK